MKAKEVRAMTKDEIEIKLAETEDKVFKQKLQKTLGQLDNPMKIRHSKKDIARLKTILAEKRSQNGTE